MPIKKEADIAWLLCICTLFVISINVANADTVASGVYIPYENNPPILGIDIPTQTWAKNTNKINALTLEDYFSDTEGDPITYTFSNPLNVTVIITENQTANATLHYVSFYPDTDFVGVNNMTFYANDGFFTTASNSVTLNVTADLIPPSSNSPSKSKTTIYQNNFVNFSANWNDNVALKSFIFSINQGGGWVNASASTFSGTQNTSKKMQQISAGAGTVVYWRFFGFDTSDNENATSIQNFTVATPPSPPGGTTGSAVSNRGGSSSDSEFAVGVPASAKAKISNFSLEESSFYVEVKQGAGTTIVFEITNTGTIDLLLQIKIEGLQGLITSINKETLNISAGQTETIIIDISADEYVLPDAYSGKIIISSNKTTKEIPIVVIVKPTQTEIDLTTLIDEEYQSVKPGELFSGRIVLENKKDVVSTPVKVYASILDFNGNTVLSNEEQITLESKKIELRKEFTLPQELENGRYIFFARAMYAQNVSLDGEVFRVGQGFSVGAFIQANFILLLALLLLTTVMTFMLRYYHNKERLRLLNIYLLTNEMKSLLKQNKIEDALSVYIKIKRLYQQHLPEIDDKNKPKLKEEMEKLANKLNNKVEPEVKELVAEQKLPAAAEVSQKQETVTASSPVIAEKKEDAK